MDAVSSIPDWVQPMLFFLFFPDICGAQAGARPALLVVQLTLMRAVQPAAQQRRDSLHFSPNGQLFTQLCSQKVD